MYNNTLTLAHVGIYKHGPITKKKKNVRKYHVSRYNNSSSSYTDEEKKHPSNLNNSTI